MTRRLVIGATLSGTPLARQHEHWLRGRDSRKRSLPSYAKFDRRHYRAGARRLASSAQRALALGEFGAVDLFAHITSGLAMTGAPLDLVSAASRVPGDEARHAELALRMAEALTGEPQHIGVDREMFERRWQGIPRLADVDAWMVEVAAIKETLAGALLAACMRLARDAIVRAHFKAIVGDEVHHARLGWFYLMWRSRHWTRAEQQGIADHAASVLYDVEPRFATGRDVRAQDRNDAAALGVLDTETQRGVVRAVFENEIVPGLDALGLGASKVWERRRRIAG